MTLIQQNMADWEKILEIFGIDNAKVLSLDNGKLSFSAKKTFDTDSEHSRWIELSVKVLNNGFNNPQDLRRKVPHALPAKVDKVAETPITQKHEWTTLDPITLLRRIVKPKFLEFLSEVELKWNKDTDTVSWQFLRQNRLLVDKFGLDAKILKLVISDKQEVLSVLNENNPSNLLALADQETCSEFANGIISVPQNQDSNSLIVEFNRGFFLQELQSIDNHISDTPVVAVKNQIISVPIKPLFAYLHNTFNGLMVFNNSETLLASPESDLVLSTPSRVHVLIDISGSMGNGFENYIGVIKDTLSEAFKKCRKLQVDVTPFNENYYTQSFSNNTDLDLFLTSLKPGGYTNINCPLTTAYQNVSSNEHVTIYLFTDGKEEGERPCTEKNVTDAAVTARQNPNMMFYSIEMGNQTDASFFERLSNNTGFSCLAFSNTTLAIEKIHGIVADLCQKRELWLFIEEGHKQYVLLEPGNLKRGPNVNNATQIMRNNKTVSLGTEQPRSMINNLYSMFQNTHTLLTTRLHSLQEFFNPCNELSPYFQHALCTIAFGMMTKACNMSGHDNQQYISPP